MPNSLKSRTRHALEVAIAFTPWVTAAYVFYWLDLNGIWTSETAHRGKMSVVLLGAGMGLSFLIQSYFAAARRRR
jgi:hypothetical protein